MAIEVTRAQVDEMIAHAHADDSVECCGILAGKGNRVEATFRCLNKHSSPFIYLIDPLDYNRVQREVDERGLDIIGYYHSHLMSRAYPSQTDIVGSAAHPSAVYAIVSLEDTEKPDVRAFRIADRKEAIEVGSVLLLGRSYMREFRIVDQKQVVEEELAIL